VDSSNPILARDSFRPDDSRQEDRPRGGLTRALRRHSGVIAARVPLAFDVRDSGGRAR